jgi:hypothetical protein
MPPFSNARRPVGRQTATPARGKKARAKRGGAGLALPHERDESSGAVAVEVDPVMAQAQRDIDAGLVDTDMRATPGLDAQRRAELVPGPGGQPPAGKRSSRKR